MKVYSFHAALLQLVLVLTLAASKANAASSSSDDGKGPPPFFLQDSTDGMCLSGEIFKRCSIDTLFYVVGSPGEYQIHKLNPDNTDKKNDEDNDGVCISKRSCNPNDANKILPTKLNKCNHCGAQKWNILGDASTGYIMSENDGETCIFRESNTASDNQYAKALTAPCDSEEVQYTPLQLQFATSNDIELMSSPGARLIAAAADGDLKQVKKLILEDEVNVNARDWDDLTPLTPACAAGHLDVIQFLLSNGADVNLSDKDGITPLMEASIMGHTQIISMLMEHGATVDTKASSDVTALWLASGEGRTEVVKLLLGEKGHADPNNVRQDGISALMTASVNGHYETVKVLLEYGADSTHTDSEGLTPLINAAENGNVKVLEALVNSVSQEDNKRYDYVNAISNSGFNALIVAAAHGHEEACQFLLSSESESEGAKAQVDFMHEKGVTALMYAAAGGHTQITKLLIEHGANVNLLHANGGSALIEASTAGALEALEVLIEAGATVDLIDSDGVTALMSAASQGHLDICKLLLDHLSEKQNYSHDELIKFINLLSHSGGSSIMFAAGGGHPDVTQYLIDKGADYNAIAQATPEYLETLAQLIEAGESMEEEPHIDGVTALHVAAQAGHLECVQILLQAGARADIQDDEKRTPLLLAVKGNFGDTASELVKNGNADPNTPYIEEDTGDIHNLLMDSIIVENEEFALLLIEQGADLYYQDEHQVTTLLQAAHRGMLSVVQALLEKHSNNNNNNNSEYIDATSDEGITPLIASASEGHKEILTLLLQHGANVNAVDKDGTSALMAASARGHKDSVQILLETKEANVNTQNIDGHTALMFAYNGKNQVETLWERYNQFVQEAKATSTSSSSSEESLELSSEGGEIDDGGTGPIIQEALQSHIELVDLLIQYGADESLKDKEGHTAKDFDFHPEIDAEVIQQEEMAEQMRDSSRNEL